jgi:hypothetical protein
MAANEKYIRNTLKSRYIAHMRSSSLQAYHQLFESVEKPFLYTAPWWLEATCGTDRWNAVIRYDGKKPVAGMAYHQTSIRGLSAIITPPLTQWVSILSSGNVADTDIESLLAEIPEVPIFDLTMQSIGEIHLPDDRFPMELRYSYVLPFVEKEDSIRQGYNEGLRRNIRQSEQMYSIEESEDVNTFLSLCTSSFGQQKMKTPTWMESVIPIVLKQLQLKQCGMLLFASFEGRVVAGILTAWDGHMTYYLAGGRKAGDQAASAHALLLDRAIAMAHSRKTGFDFEGSMHPGIANFFQSFGASPSSYWHIKKYRGLGKLWSALH